MCRKLSQNGFTLVEIMVVVAILGLLIAIGVPGFLNARNKGRFRSEAANLKAISDNVATYGVNERKIIDDIIRLWPSSPTLSDPSSYIRKQLTCPVNRSAYMINSNTSSCTAHGSETSLTESNVR